MRTWRCRCDPEGYGEESVSTEVVEKDEYDAALIRLGKECRKTAALEAENSALRRQLAAAYVAPQKGVE